MILIVSILFFLINCQKPEPLLKPINEARVVQRLENGNFEVTPAFILWAYNMKGQIELLELELKKCRELLDEKFKSN